MMVHTNAKKSILLVSLIIGVTAVLLARPAQNHRGIAIQNQRSAQKDVNEYWGPIVDYEAASKTLALQNTNEKNVRSIREDRYRSQAPEPLGALASNMVDFGVHNDWAVGLPALPISQSDAIILGKVVDAQAYLAKDKTSVYSEFKIRAQKVLKNGVSAPIKVKDILTTERQGGVVRFESGRLLRFLVFGQNLPQAGKKYLFFLKHNNEGEDYHILTAYEFQGHQVYALDQYDKFKFYQGQNERAFLLAVQEAMLPPAGGKSQ